MAEETLRRAETHADDEVRQYAGAAVCIGTLHTGSVARAVAAGRAAVQLGGATSSVAQRYGAHIFLGQALFEADQPEDADRVFQAGAVRFIDPALTTACRQTLKQLFAVGEGIQTFFQREVAWLPPPHLSAG